MYWAFGADRQRSRYRGRVSLFLHPCGTSFSPAVSPLRLTSSQERKAVHYRGGRRISRSRAALVACQEDNTGWLSGPLKLVRPRRSVRQDGPTLLCPPPLFTSSIPFSLFRPGPPTSVESGEESSRKSPIDPVSSARQSDNPLGPKEGDPNGVNHLNYRSDFQFPPLLNSCAGAVVVVDSCVCVEPPEDLTPKGLGPRLEVWRQPLPFFF